jgi:hypothetical protein
MLPENEYPLTVPENAISNRLCPSTGIDISQSVRFTLKVRPSKLKETVDGDRD